VLAGAAGSAAAAHCADEEEAAADAEADAEDEAASQAPRPRPSQARPQGAPPTFVPLDPFTVNLADRDAERYAQVGVTLELDDAKPRPTRSRPTCRPSATTS
jgi:flagellar protein FliL